MLNRKLEPEVMDSDADAHAYNAMDHTEVNRSFVEDLLEYSRGVWNEHGKIGTVDSTSQNQGVEFGFRMGDVLDLGTGTALIPVELCHQHRPCRVMAIDMAVSMLDLAVYNVEAAGLADRITLAQADAKRLVFEDDMFDVAMSNSIVHHLPEPLDGLREMLRVTRSGGILFVRDLMRPQNQECVEQLVQTYVGDESEYSQKLFEESLHAALTLSEMQELVAGLDFDPETVHPTSDHHWTWAVRR